ncbi:MAG: leucine-rich repeat protein [Clostridia bacterium]|nr:leucine-rich repeat protein [Clostridia bacterium]
MSIKKSVALFLAILLCMTFLYGCTAESESFTAEPVTLTPLAELDRSKLGDYTANEETRNRVAALKQTFDGMPETEVSLFAVTEHENSCEITKYLGTGKAASVRIPAVINGKPVTAIANGAFAGDADVKALYIPDGVISIGTNILTDSPDVSALRTPFMGASRDSEQYLGYFFGAESYINNPLNIPATLKYLEIGEGAEKIASYSLFECNDLELITLPESVKTVESYALYGCTSLLAINVDHLTTLAPHALHSCSALTKLTFSETLTSIGLGALEGCEEIRTLTLPFVGGSATENTYLGYIFGAETPDFAPGYYPQYLTRITVLDICTALGQFAMYECDMLTEVTLPDTLTSIGLRAFSGCLYLESITFPNALTSIGDNAFFGCRSLKALDLSQTALTSIGTNAFYFCDALTEVKLPDSLTVLPASCFAQCNQLASINLENIVTIGKNAFRGCPDLPDGTY